jgi:hypothetical protein
MTTEPELKPLERIPLSKERLDLLIEMCRVIFPKYSAWEYYGDGLISYFYGKGKSSSIHWLELCLTHLPDAMYGEEQAFLSGGQFGTAREYVMARMNSGIHPVSALHEKVFVEYKVKINKQDIKEKKTKGEFR